MSAPIQHAQLNLVAKQLAYISSAIGNIVFPDSLWGVYNPTFINNTFSFKFYVDTSVHSLCQAQSVPTNLPNNLGNVVSIPNCNITTTNTYNISGQQGTLKITPGQNNTFMVLIISPTDNQNNIELSFVIGYNTVPTIPATQSTQLLTIGQAPCTPQDTTCQATQFYISNQGTWSSTLQPSSWNISNVSTTGADLTFTLKINATIQQPNTFVMTLTFQDALYIIPTMSTTDYTLIGCAQPLVGANYTISPGIIVMGQANLLIVNVNMLSAASGTNTTQTPTGTTYSFKLPITFSSSATQIKLQGDRYPDDTVRPRDLLPSERLGILVRMFNPFLRFSQ